MPVESDLSLSASSWLLYDSQQYNIRGVVVCVRQWLICEVPQAAIRAHDTKREQ